MQFLHRITAEDEAVDVNEPGDIGHAYLPAENVGSGTQSTIQLFERPVKPRRRDPDDLVGDPVACDAFPECNLIGLVGVAIPQNRPAAASTVIGQRLRRFRRARPRLGKSKADCPQIVMQIVFVAQQLGHFRVAAFGDQPRGGEPPVEQRDDVVAFDMDFAIDDQRRDQPARIDAEKPFAQVPAPGQVDRMRLPLDTLQIEDDPGLLRTRRAMEVEQMHALPTEHFACADIGLQELNHCASFRGRARRRSCRRRLPRPGRRSGFRGPGRRSGFRGPGRRQP